MKSSLMSEIDVALAQVNVVLSVIEVKLSECPDVKSKSPILPRLGNILLKMEGIVSQHLIDSSPDPNMSWDDTGHNVWYHEEEEDFVSDVFKEEDVVKEEDVGALSKSNIN